MKNKYMTIKCGHGATLLMLRPEYIKQEVTNYLISLNKKTKHKNHK